MKLIFLIILLSTVFICISQDNNDFYSNEYIILEENENAILRDINSIKFHNDKFLITNFMNCIVVYDTNGKHVNYVDLSRIKFKDLLDNHADEYFNSVLYYFFDNHRMLKYNELLEFANEEDFKIHFPVFPVYADFKNDSTLICGINARLAMIELSKLHNIKYNVIAPIVDILSEYDIKKSEFTDIKLPISFASDSDLYVGTANNLLINNDSIIQYSLKYNYVQNTYENNSNALVSTKLNGELNHVLLDFASLEIVDKNEMFYFIENKNNNIFVLFPYYKKIINISSKEKINLSIPFSNDDYNIVIYNLNPTDIDNRNKAIKEMLNFKINSFSITERNTFFIELLIADRESVSSEENNLNFKRKLQEYDMAGNLIKEIEFDDDPHIGLIRNVSYYNGNIYVFYKSEEDWLLFKRNWNEL